MVRVSRGQLVLATAAVLAAALTPVLLAYLQLGYHADTAATVEFEDSTVNAERVLSQAVHEASGGVPANHSWGQRRAASKMIRGRLSPRLDRLETARIESGTHLRVRYNQTAAEAWATANCPSGDGRQFGPCRAEDSVVLQNRIGEATPLAVAFDVTVTRERGTTEVTLVVRRATESGTPLRASAAETSDDRRRARYVVALIDRIICNPGPANQCVNERVEHIPTDRSCDILDYGLL